MKERIITRNRTVRPSTRLASSTSYKVNTEKVTNEDELIVNKYFEDGIPKETYKFHGSKIANRKSIHFQYKNGSIIWPQYLK